MVMGDVERLWAQHKEKLMRMERQQAFEWLMAEVREGRMVPRQVNGVMELWSLDKDTWGDNHG